MSNTCVGIGGGETADTTTGDGDGDSGDGDGDGDSGDGAPGDGDGAPGDGDGAPGDGDGAPGDGDGAPGDGDGAPGDGDGAPGDGDGDACVETGCTKVDLLFALDGSASMAPKVDMLKSNTGFLGIQSALGSLNCGGIDYRIGVTGDNDNGWIVPDAWAEPNPWFARAEFSPAEITGHFQAAATKVSQAGGAPNQCGHVLSSAVGLLATDTSGFLRDDALLVVVLVTNIDDYGWYSQLGENWCDEGCTDSVQPVADLQATLVALKGGDAAGVAAVVIAGDPTQNAGVNGCGQPRSCANVFHAARLFSFATMQVGPNGYQRNLCVAPFLADTVKSALTGKIDMACKGFEPGD